MNEFISQCKGVDANKLKISDSEVFYSSIKYDGVYVQIQKVGSDVSFFTSAGKEFSCVYGVEFQKLDFDFKIETEYTCNGGKLGTRVKADSEIKKAVKDSSFQLTGKFMIFDELDSENSFIERFAYGLSRFRGYPMAFDVVFWSEVTLGVARDKLLEVSKDGWEGLFLIKPAHLQTPGKKSKDAIKLKYKFTADLVVTEINGLWLSLVDDDGIVAKVQISVSIAEKIKVGCIVEIEHEQIVKSYNVAVFKDIRFDKMDS